MRQQWGLTAGGARRFISLEGLGDRAANAMGSVMDQLMQQYPQTAERIRAFGSSAAVTKAVNAQSRVRYKNISGRAYADASKPGFIRLNQSKARKYDEMVASLKDDVASGFHPAGLDNVEGVVAHEFGHHLKWQAENGPGGAVGLRDALEEVIAKHAGVARTDRGYPRARYDTMRGLSRYAASDLDELAGEALGEVTMSPNPRPFAVDVVKTLVRFAEGAP